MPFRGAEQAKEVASDIQMSRSGRVINRLEIVLKALSEAPSEAHIYPYIEAFMARHFQCHISYLTYINL